MITVGSGVAHALPPSQKYDSRLAYVVHTFIKFYVVFPSTTAKQIKPLATQKKMKLRAKLLY